MGSSWTSVSRPTSSRGRTAASASRSDGPLDMRFDANEAVATAADLVNQLREAELANLFFEFGEERFSRRIARRVVEERKKRTDPHAGQLAEIVRRAIPGHARAGPIDPATRVFQALRIAVNDELGAARNGPGGDSRAARRPAGEQRSSAFIHWKTGASSGPSRPTRS